MKEFGKVFHTDGSKKKSFIAIRISDKIDFKANIVIRDKEEHSLIKKDHSNNRI